MRKIRLSFVIIVFLSFINVVKALDDSDNALIEQNILYAMEQVNDNMSDHDKAMVFGVYTQLGNTYKASKYDQSYYSVFLEHNSVCAGFNDAFRLLNQTAGLSCERVSSNMGDHAWNICNLDNEWTYFDATAGTGNHPNRIDFTVKFKSRDDFPKQLASMFNFSDVRLDSNNFFKNYILKYIILILINIILIVNINLVGLVLYIKKILIVVVKKKLLMLYMIILILA